MAVGDNRLPARSQRYEFSQSAKWTNVGGDLIQNVSIGYDPPYLLTGFSGTRPSLSRERAVELPSRMLRARFEAVQFVGRNAELAQLADWCGSSADVSVLLIHGPGGQGKTRLLQRFAAAQTEAGWTVWQARHQMDTNGISDPEIEPAEPSEQGVLVIADYAERWPKADIQKLVKDTRVSSGAEPVRLLLAARPTGIWWRSLRNWLNEELEVQATAIELSPLGCQVPRRELFTAALHRFADVLGVSGIEQIELPAFLDREGVDQVLAVHMAALAAVDACGRGVHAPEDLPRISAYLLRREYAHWEKLYAHAGEMVSTSPKTMGHAVFAATLAGPLSGDRRWDEGIEILEAAQVTDSRDTAERILTDHDLCYPSPVGDMVLQPLYPDRLGEDFLALAIPGHGLEQDHPSDPWASGAVTRLTMLDAKRESSVARISKAIIVLTAASERWPHLRLVLANLLHASPELAIAGGGVALPALAQLSDFDTGVLKAIMGLLPDRNENLDVGHAALSQRLINESLATTDDPVKRAALYIELGRRLGNAADHDEAINATRQAVDIYRQLARKNPVHEPDLAASLNDFSSRLSEAGRPEEALEAARQAVEIYTRLTQSDPSTHEPGLALSLNNLCDGLSQLGQQREALEVRQKTVEVYRHLAKVDSATHEPGLVASLNDLCSRLSEAGRWPEALETARQAVEVRSRLAQPSRAAYGPILVPLLGKLRNRLQEVKQWKDALEAAIQALSVNDSPADADPESYDPDLAKSRSNLGLTLSGLEYLENALKLTEQAAEVYCQLAEADPATHRPDLIKPLDKLSG